jgi:hypothetical protein
MPRRTWFALAIIVLSVSATARAQSLGIFSWQLAPFCNVVSVEVTQVGSVYRLTGADDQCGTALATAVGLAYPSPNGTIGFSLLIVTAPGGVPVHLSATLRRSDLGGRWRDSAGNTGDMLPPHARRAGGRSRPEPVFGATWVQPEGGPDRGINVVVTSDTGDVGGDAAALFGQFGEGSGFDRPGNAAVRGDSGADTGVIGTSRSGSGLRGLADGGVGVEGHSETGVGVRASHGHGGTALEVVNGAFRVSGSLRPAFVHTSDGSNTRGDSTCVDHPLSNGRPDAMILVTHRYGGGAVNIPAVGVYYAYDLSRWCVFTEGGTPMPSGIPFNVLVISQ